MERRLAAILAADMVGYSRLMAADETGTLSRQKAHRKELIDPKITGYGGRVVKTTGDGVLVEFASVVDALRCAVTIQLAMSERETSVPEEIRIAYRIGINLGDIIFDDDDIYGDGVNVAARLEALAEPGGICVSRTVVDHVKGKVASDFEDQGERQVKNIPEPIHVYRVLMEPEAAGESKAEAKRRAWWQRPAAGAVAVFAVAAIGIMVWQPWAPDVKPTSIEKMAPPIRDKPSIAVLPFANMSGDPEQEYFADGISEDIITGLSGFDHFFVVSRNSSFTYKGVSVDVRDVARDLGVQYVLEGSVRKFDNRLRITAQLIDAIEDRHVWAERYDRELKDVFQVQDEITQSIVTSVAPEFFSAELRRAQRTEERNLEAWDAYMQGYWHQLRFTKDDNAAAQRLLRKAIDLDPRQANYHGLLAVTHLLAGLYGWSESRAASFRVALESAEHGLALDDQNSQALRSLGLVHFFSKNHDVALSYYERAVAASPNEAENWALLGSALGVAGEYDAALDRFETALHLSPRDVHIPSWYNYMAVAAFVVGRDEEAAEWARKTVESNPQFLGGYRTLAASSGNLGRLTEAEAAREKLLELLPNVTIEQLRESLPYFKDPDDLERYLDGLRKAGLPE